MRNVPSSLTTSDLKAQARQWRTDEAGTGNRVTHSQALEAVARVHGFRDWNTASGILPATRDPAYSIGQRVKGRYLKQPFRGTILAVAAQAGGDLYQLTVQFDEPVDVVSFDSFSALRQRVVAKVDRDGDSPSRTSDGEPHMRISVIA